MKRFFGTYPTTLDKQNRIVFPARFRKGLENENLYVIKHPKKLCLEIRTEEEWNELYNIFFYEAEISEEQAEEYENYFASAIVTSIDKGGRITLPRELTEKIGLNSQVTIMGKGLKIEIWATKKMEEEQMQEKIALHHYEVMNKVRKKRVEQWKEKRKAKE